MAVEPGLLIQPYVSVIWGDLNLSAYPGASGELERVAQKVKLDFTKDQDAPSCTFELAPNVDGFQIAAEIRNSPALLTEITTVRMGYPNMPEPMIEAQFLYTGLTYATGLDPELAFTVTSALKGSWTQNKISFTMEEEIPLSELPEFLKKKAGKGANPLKFKFVGKAEQDAQEIMIKKNVNAQTPQVALTEVLKEHGMELRTGDTGLDSTLVIGYTAGKEGNLEDEGTVVGGGKAVTAVRRVHILGPGLMRTAKRKQNFTLGQTDKTGGAKRQASSTSETELIEGTRNKGNVARVADATSKNKEGTTGTSDKSQGRSSTTKSVADKKKAKAALADSLAMELTADFPMVPQVCGMKPADIIAIPSLTGGTVEDYEVESISYQMNDTGEVMMSIKGKRPYLEQGNMLDSGSVAEVAAIAAGLTTLDSWNQYYWRQGPELAWPLAG